MANSEIKFKVDITPQTITFDLVPKFKDMSLSVTELDIFRGDNVSINFVISQNGLPFSLSGYTILYQAKRAIGDTDFIFSKTASITDSVNGKCRVDLVGNDVATAGSYTSQLYLTQTGLTITALQLPIQVIGSV